MTSKGVEFKQTDDGYEISTAQVVDEAELLKRIAGIEIQKHRFKKDIEESEGQIVAIKERIEIQKKNITYADEDLERAYEFLRSSGKEELIKKIEEAFEEATREMPKEGNE
jgi:hypothetical protein